MTTLANKSRRFFKGIKSKGFEYFLYFLNERFPEWMFRYYHTYLTRLEKPALRTRDNKGMNVRLATENDADLIEQMGISKEKTIHRLRRGDKCTIIHDKNRILSILWAATGKIYNRYAGSIVDTGGNGLLIYGVFSIAEMRKKGLYSLGLKHHLNYYRSQGRTVAFAVVEAINDVSRKAHHKLGYRIVGETIYCVFLGCSICYYRKWPNRSRKFHVFFKRPPKNLEWA